MYDMDAIKKRCLLAGGRTLQILNAREDNAGRYTCIATNEAGETLKHYEVIVYSTEILFFSFFNSSFFPPSTPFAVLLILVHTQISVSNFV